MKSCEDCTNYSIEEEEDLEARDVLIVIGIIWAAILFGFFLWPTVVELIECVTEYGVQFRDWWATQ